ncbi:hypothetical protein M011DRAFT_468467 [Sporormia fimetaria CBS 119925]|uniref:SWIM-type domain-containing protein n=1 Tax=Sporormia fimetaria CBS 119925 TaxID=1340428 RepID=A0A6A6VAP9_9PLEO|nr:hypothetical protein M011DRAFT_468467 [Sporormia fimetaria CBS 119925]
MHYVTIRSRDSLLEAALTGGRSISPPHKQSTKLLSLQLRSDLKLSASSRTSLSDLPPRSTSPRSARNAVTSSQKMPTSLPSPPPFVIQLLASLTTSPHAAGTIPSNANPLLDVSEATRKKILTLHVLFPNELSAALDLLDRGLVTRCRVRRDSDAESDACRQQSNVPSEDAAVAGAVGTENETQQSGAGVLDIPVDEEGHTRGGEAGAGGRAADGSTFQASASGLQHHEAAAAEAADTGLRHHEAAAAEAAETGLRHREAALASATSPPSVQNCAIQSGSLHQAPANASSNPPHTLNPSHAANPRVPDPSPSPPATSSARSESQTFYLVHSAASTTTSTSVLRDSAAARDATSAHSPHTYQIHLLAWHCTCPAFTFAAFPADDEPGLDVAVTEIRFSQLIKEFRRPQGPQCTPQCTHDEDRAEERGNPDRGNPELAGLRSKIMGLGFGIGEKRVSPVCKHLLACALVEYAPLFGGRGREREVGVSEAAGWAAGWGD